MHLLSLRDIDKDFILDVIEDAVFFEEALVKRENLKLAFGKILATLFYEPSTRTRLSFETAMLRLGGKVISAPDMLNVSSAKKGESLQDTGKIVSSYADIIAMRHPLPFTVKELATCSEVPVINAGDGINEHPSQTLIDLFTIKKELGTIDNIKIAFLGDLKFGRTIHSLAYALKYFAAEIYFVSPDELKIPEELREELKILNVKFEELENIQEILPKIDVLYQTRVQEERFKDKEVYERLKNRYIIIPEVLKRAQQKMILLHPLPRINEITPEVDFDDRACYFRQAKNGVPIRMSIIKKLLKI